MARARNIKPGFFTNADLLDMPFEARLLFAGLWTIADREGRLKDRPKQIRIDVFPSDAVDVDALLTALAARNMIKRYQVGDEKYLWITGWARHQNPHHTERASEIPAYNSELTVKPPLDIGSTPQQIVLIPDSLIPDSGFRIPDPLIKAKPLRAALAPVDLPAWLNPEDWQAYREHRGSKFTQKAQDMAIKQLDTWRQQGQDPGAILRQSVMNGWKGLFELKAKNRMPDLVSGLGPHGQATAAAGKAWLESTMEQT